MLYFTKISTVLSYFLPFVTKNKKDDSWVPSLVPTLTGRVTKVEEQWLLIDHTVYIDIKEAKMFDQEHVSLKLTDIEEGDVVHIWTIERNLIQTTPALGTASYVELQEKEM
ncbi:hypothetical protein [Halalkalibacter krulwichiae]|uniref:DUF5666 domain-containing protein n=1 Tax=Halalkalibacter krulwichiae TaxID=199441 RepID=A0A1X9MAI3_9BACI|nr:hypothetical protein [Halalkalibacter krulwichiae]ARK30417.1 hypothetical protein BkAM31D_11605 [Halalkalibacter krulwichiae]